MSPKSHRHAARSVGGLVLLLVATASGFARTPHPRSHRRPSPSIAAAPALPRARRTAESGTVVASSTASAAPAAAVALDDTPRLEALARSANAALDEHGSDVLKTLKAKVGVVYPEDDDDGDVDGGFQRRYLRLGLVATEPVKAGDQVASLPFYDTDGSGLALAPHLAAKVVYKDVLPEGYDGWTGDVGLLALLLLNEFARMNVNTDAGGGAVGTGVDLPSRKEGARALMAAWAASLPAPGEMRVLHPLLWDEDDQETLQTSSTKKVYRLLDDVDDDAAWLEEHLWGPDRRMFPETVTLAVGDGAEQEQRPCFSPDGFRHAVALVRSRASFVDGSLRLLPYLDHANHADVDAYEIEGGSIGTLWGSSKGASLRAGKNLRPGDEVRISYGPKGPADYLLDHGFVPPMCQLSGSGGDTAVAAELAFEVDEADRFIDDKLDILEFETYDLAPLEPAQTFDVTGGPGATGEPDPAMIQFLRMVKLAGKDAFLLESIFRKEIWGFMSEPVSEDNERDVTNAVIEACQTALSEMMEAEGDDDPTRLCALVREAERDALDRTLSYVKQEAEALDLKEYYQQRRLKNLGLDSEWALEDDLPGGGGRLPGGADYDW